MVIRQLNIIEMEFHVGRPAKPHHRLITTDSEASHPFIDKEHGNPTVALGWVGYSRHNEEIRDRTVGDEMLHPVQNPFAVFAFCTSFDPSRIGPSTRFSERDRTDAITRDTRF